MSIVITAMNNSLTIIIFGATGDLYKNKLSSALFNLFSLGFLPSEFRIIGFARRPMTDLEFQNFTRDAVLSISKNQDKEKLEKFLKHIAYIEGNLKELKNFKILGAELAQSEAESKFCANKIFYFAVPPVLYKPILENISGSGLNTPCASLTHREAHAWTRILMEKPFGSDISEAKQLNRILGRLFHESEIFRVDHYLAKETMQNLLSFRFQNGILESLWNNKNIEKIKIAFYEKDNKKNSLYVRGDFYDQIGALKDVGQSHMMQMFALSAMEKPKSRDTKDIQNARGVVLEKLFLLDKKSVLRGQYKGYLKEPNIKDDSKTETFFRLILGVKNKRWQGVLFEMESGKALDKEEMSIEVYFKKINARLKFFISLSGKRGFLSAHEKVFHDCFLGDKTFFVSKREIMAEWKIVANIIKSWRATPFVIYPKGISASEIT